MEKALQEFLCKKGLFLRKALGKGHSSRIFLVADKKGKKLVLKMERPDSTRYRMAEREAENLALANKAGIGPKLKGFDFGRRIVLMEFIKGTSFAEWLFAGPPKRELECLVRELKRQASALDIIGLDHGQLAGRGKNILVRKGVPVIIDFEKASQGRKCHNASAIEAFLFRNPHGAIAKKTREILGGV